MYAQPFGTGGNDQFAGHKDDPESGLHYNLARSYNPIMSRWPSADPIIQDVYDSQSLNKYTYNRNNPINLVDPDGRYFSILDYDMGWLILRALLQMMLNDAIEDTLEEPRSDPEMFVWWATRSLWLPDDWFQGGGGGTNGGGAVQPQNEGLLPAAYQLVTIALKITACTDLFGTRSDGRTASQIFEDIYHQRNDNRIVFEEMPSNEDASTEPNESSFYRWIVGRYHSVTITINTRESIINDWNDGIASRNALTLLHELGHALRFMGFEGGAFTQDDRRLDINDQNDQLIRDNCLH